ncbi:MAG: MATE family efflux transporter [Bacteroidales bacterium]|nr:MATE family efflux transporter [Bacteroidales bacterium]
MAGSVVAPTELGTKKIGSLLRMYAVPGIIAQTAASLYNMVDSIYIGHIKDVGSYAISGLAVTFPLMNLSSALGTLVGVGGMTLMSVLLGQKDYDNANKVLGNVLTLNVAIGLIFTTFMLLFLEPVLRFFGASDATLPFAREYMTIILLGNVITHLYFGLNGAIRASGKPKVAMGLTLFTVTSNAILDPIFIFVLGMGIKGAAIATILCQFMALTYSFRFFLDRSRVPHFPKGLFKLDWRIARQSLAIGLGPFLMNAAACMVNLFVNQQLGKYGGDLAIGAYGIVNRITFMFVMIVMGFNQGLQPIAGYNYGARQYSRVKEIFKLTAKWAILTTTLCFLISELLPGAAVGLFTNDPYLLGLAEKGLRTMNLMMPLVGFTMITTTFFQCLGMVNKSIFLSLSRQLIFLLPMLYLLPLKFQEQGIWMSFPISDGITIVISFLFIAALFKKLNKLNDGDDPSILGSNIK